MEIFNTKTNLLKLAVVYIILPIYVLTACGPDTEEKLGITDEDKPDYTSPVPQYEFPTTLEKQEEALKTNPLMQRFAESREALSSDPYRPIYHFVNPEGRLNDPNGLSFWNGNWHLFYQAYPPEDPRQHWGHAISKDLIHWRDLPLAIYPNPERAVYSGSTLVEEDRVIAMYHGTEVGNMVAVSDDPILLNWEKVTGEAVIPIPEKSLMISNSGDTLPIVFDPAIWKKDEMYYSLSGGTLPHEPSGKRVRANFLLRSPDLENWEYMHPFVEGDDFTMVGDDGACPYFWPIGDRHILLFFSHISGGQYLLGDYDKERDKFVTTSHGKFNHGPYGPAGVHAPSATPDGNGGVITIFNMNPGKPTEGWDQIMTLPIRLTLEENDQLKIEPAGDIESLRYEHEQVEPMVLPANEEIVFENINGNAMEIIAEIDPQNAQQIELNVLRSPNREEYTRISFYKNRGYRDRDLGIQNSFITIESTYSSVLPDVQSRAPETAQLHLKDGETLKLRIFIDKSVVEVYANGKQYAAVRVYPGLDESTGVSMRSQGQDSELISLDAWQMQNIWNTTLDEWHQKEVWR